MTDYEIREVPASAITGLKPRPVKRAVRLPSGAFQAMEEIEMGDLIAIEEFKR